MARQKLELNKEVVMNSAISVADKKIEEWKKLQHQIIDCVFVSSDGYFMVNKMCGQLQIEAEKVNREAFEALDEVAELRKEIEDDNRSQSSEVSGEVGIDEESE